MKETKLPKKVIRDLDNYHHFINLALDSGIGKYRNLSAESLHDMRNVYWSAKRVSSINSLRIINNFVNSIKRGSDFDIPMSLYNYLLRNIDVY